MSHSNEPSVIGPRAGFRLARLEVFNWGTFHERVWTLTPGGDNALLTGDIGSGKSTLVDAITTLLVPPQRAAYNKAAGADAKERTLRSYVLGHYKSERGESGNGARAVALRGHDSYSVILAQFTNEGFGQTVTLAQVFWTKDVEGQPTRMFVVADEPLGIVSHFTGFGPEIGDLRKRLRRSKFEVTDSFPPYGSAFRRRFGIDNEQALELFHQTVSMKAVGNLTDFVRQHMLQPFPVEPRIAALMGHFDDLTRAHEAVVTAKAQIAKLDPLVADGARHAELSAEVESMRGCREALRPWFAQKKGLLLDRRISSLAAELSRLDERVASLGERRGDCQVQRDDLKRAIADNGGDRLEAIKADVLRRQTELDARRRRADKYDSVAQAAGLPPAADLDGFTANREAIAAARDAIEAERAQLQNELVDATTEFRELRLRHTEIQDELTSLRARKSNIPARMLALRAGLCRAVGLDDEALPFAGELMRVLEGEEAWEGAVERLVHGFGLSLLVPDAHYADVSRWVDATHLGQRVVYYRVRPQRASEHASLHADSLVHKIAVRPESQFYAWLDAEIARRFDYACCDTLDQFRRETQAITRAGQIKTGGARHEKDDRNRLDDRARYVLGWTNESKIAAFEKQARDLEVRMQKAGDRLAKLGASQSALADRIARLEQLGVFETYRDLDWKPLATEIHTLEDERQRLESESDVLRTLADQLVQIEGAMREIEASLDLANRERGSAAEKQDAAQRLNTDCREVLGTAPDHVMALFPALDLQVPEALGAQSLTVESCDNREKDVRDWQQGRIDADDRKIRSLVEKIVKAMEAYRHDYPLETRDTDATVGATGEFAAMLSRLRSDDLPRFEGKFKELLNENTIREVANFQSQLARERQTIHERIDTINRSLRDIDYNPGRYIVLQADTTADAEIREFQQNLRTCTEGALTGSDDEAYSEAKFLNVQRIIERFRGRDGSAEIDSRWTRKVTDVRNWFAFSASERWREDDREHEHYTDSGGKSGGQKEKLAYTVLAASLAYQFGLEWGVDRSRTFHFVVIDEAFGRGSDESTRYGLDLFGRLNLQLLIVTPLQKIHVIEPHVAGVGFVHNEDGKCSVLRNLTIEEYRAERAARTG